MERKEREYYSVRLKNGNISISIFDKGNPIPHTYYKGDIDSKKTQEFIRDVMDWFSCPKVKEFLKGFVKTGETYNSKLKKDFEG